MFHLSSISSRRTLMLVLIGIAALAAALTGGRHAWGQAATAALNGTIADPSGLPIVGAQVILTNSDTQGVQASTTNSAGRYVFAALNPGHYVLRVEMKGFQTATIAPFTVTVNQTLTEDVSLEVGTSTQEVVVTSSAINIETTTTELGTAIQSNEVVGLPLNGRNFTELLALTPGTSPISTDQSSGYAGNSFGGHAVGTFTFPAVNGQPNRSNMFLLDGFTDYAFLGTYAVAPIVDSIQEFKVQSHNDSSAYGGAMGGIVNVLTSGGTAHFHGDVWEFLRNSAFDARNYFNTTVAPYKQNQFGATFGGPVPSFGFLKSKGVPNTFFFVAYEGFRSSKAAELLDIIPTQAQLGGDLSGVSAQIYNPFSTAPDPANPGKYTRQAFTGNQITSSLINQQLVAYAKAIYPVVTSFPVNGHNFVDTTPNLTNNDTGSFRVDHAFSSQLSAWATLTKFNSPLTFATGIPGVLQANNEGGYLVGGSTTWSSHNGGWIIEGRFGHNNVNVVQSDEYPSKLATAYQAGGFNSQYVTGFTGGRSFNPGQTIPGFTTIPEGLYEGNQIADIWEGAGDVTHVVGRHTLQFGIDINTNNNAQPILYVTQGYDAFQTSNLESTTPSGSALASFLLGLPVTSNRRNVNITTHGGWVDGFYIQDQWKATHRLELNVGFRYDVTLWPIYGSPTQGNLYVGDTDMDTGQYILQAVPPACSTGVSPCMPTTGGGLPANVIVTSHANHSIINNSYDNWQPRFGFSYLATNGTVLRGGISRFFDNWAGINQLATNNQGTWPDTSYLAVSNLNGVYPAPTTGQNPLGLGSGVTIQPAPTPFTQVNFFTDPFYKNAYSIEWNFGVQQQIRNSTVVEMDYVGSHSLRLDSNLVRNVALYPGPGAVSARSPFSYITPTQYDKSNSNGNYNALQVKARTAFGRSSTLLGSYTWSKTIDLGCDGYFGGGASCSVQDPNHVENDRSVAGYDVPQLGTLSYVYQLPIGSGKSINVSQPVLNEILGNWQFDGIYTARSGVPFHTNASAQISNIGNNYERPNKTCGNPYRNSGNTQSLNTSCFSAPAAYTFGSEPRNDLRSAHVTNFDASIIKDFPLGEQTARNVQFRTDFFNAFNEAAFGVPDTTLTDSTFGRVTSTAQTEREIQFALKVTF